MYNYAPLMLLGAHEGIAGGVSKAFARAEDDGADCLQIFTRNLIGPIFIELIQRRNHLSFGEGNFGALFRSIERDQQRRGYLT